MANPGGWGSRATGPSSTTPTTVPGGGWGSRANQTATAAPKKGGGGFLGAIEGAAHVVADKASRAGHDIVAIPGGLVHMATTEAHAIKNTVEHPWVTGAQKQALLHEYTHPLAPPAEGDPQAAALNLVRGQVKAAVTSLQHPLRDPFQTLLTVAPITHGLGRVAEIGGRVDRTVPRSLRQGDAEVGMPPLSRNAGTRVVQRGYDKTLQRGLDTNPEGRVARHAAKRVGGQIAEAERPRQNMRKVPADDLERAGKELRGKIGNHSMPNAKMAQAALRLTSENSTAKEAANYHALQAAKGVAPKANLKLAKLYRQMDERGLLTQDERGNVQVDAAKFPKLAAVDAKLAAVQKAGDQIVSERGLMPQDALAARLDMPGVERRAVAGASEGRTMYGPQGRGYVTHKILENRAARSPVARVGGPVVGEPRSPITAQTFKGEAMAQGKIPDNTTRLAAQHYRDLIRFVNTSEIRKRWLETGADVRRSSRDILVRQPDETAKPLTPDMEALLGRKRSTVAELEGAKTGLREHLDDIVPGWRDEKIRRWEESHSIGTPAPQGYRWVDRNTLGDLANSFAESKGKPGRLFDNVNSAVTAMTVYFKVGHVGTRVFTNAALNIMEGAAKQAPASIRLWRGLSREDRLRALAASGQHGFSAMPHEGEGFVGKAARGGANWWAKHADAPFRFNAIAYEAAKVGYRTPAAFRDFLDKAEHPETLSPVERIKVENVLKQANRENISYDRLNEKERRYIARGFWFYPWVKGSSAYAARTFLEHPAKSAVLGAASSAGLAEQQRTLGDLPSYEYGLLPLGGGQRPLVTNLSTFSPLATAGALLQIPKYAAAADQLNPAAGALLHLATRTNQYGQHSNQPALDALRSLVAPTPQAQIAEAFAGRHKDQSKKMFPTSPGLAALRMLVGPATPHHINLEAAHSAAARERSGR